MCLRALLCSRKSTAHQKNAAEQSLRRYDLDLILFFAKERSARYRLVGGEPKALHCVRRGLYLLPGLVADRERMDGVRGLTGRENVKLVADVKLVALCDLALAAV